jgi:16S rRNA (cytidine1402-2'-O)-methyltransferase
VTIKSDKFGQNNYQNRNIGELFIVATPIGNLKDITYRAIEVLSKVDLILCENTKNSLKLLSYYGIKTKLLAYNDHSNDRDRLKILMLLTQGKSIALISDAGTPLISDPGFKLVREARNSGSKVTPIPGASALLAAICAAGIPTNSFLFYGFLSAKALRLETELSELKSYKSTIIFYESPKRIKTTISVIFRIMGDRDIVIARELTKIHEEFITCKCSEFLETYEEREFKGEIVLMIAPAKAEDESDIDIDTVLTKLLKDHSLKDAVEITSQIIKLPKKEVYARALRLK